MRITIILILIIFISVPVSAMDITAPTAPEVAEKYMPENTESFSDGLIYIIKKAIRQFMPDFRDASQICLSLIGIVLLVTIIGSNTKASSNTIKLVLVLSVSSILLNSANTLINLGIQTVKNLSDYGKLLLPIMATATAAQGGLTSSAALFSGTTIFISLLSAAAVNLVIPLIYIFLCITIASSCLGADILKSIHVFTKWLITWILKISVYIFTGYMSITGVVCGTVDTSAIKATKLAISGVVPVVGSVISDASESVLLSAGVMKNAAGIYGILATIAILVGPFVRIGAQYLMLKITIGICNIFNAKQYIDILHGFCTAMGFLLAMIGVVSIMLLIGTVCFMKGVST